MSAADDLASKFTNEIISELASMLKLPTGDVRIDKLAESVRWAAGNYGDERKQDDWPKLSKQILTMYKLNEKVLKGNGDAAHDLADKIPALPAAVRARLSSWSQRAFPTPEEFRATETRKAAAQRLRGILSYGGKKKSSQMRPTGKRSNSWLPLLRIPQIPRGRRRDRPARHLVQWLAITYEEATGKKPPKVTNYEVTLRGSFSKFVHRVFEVMQIPTGNVTDLINERAIHRCLKEKSSSSRRRGVERL